MAARAVGGTKVLTCREHQGVHRARAASADGGASVARWPPPSRPGCSGGRGEPGCGSPLSLLAPCAGQRTTRQANTARPGSPFAPPATVATIVGRRGSSRPRPDQSTPHARSVNEKYADARRAAGALRSLFRPPAHSSVLYRLLIESAQADAPQEPGPEIPGPPCRPGPPRRLRRRGCPPAAPCVPGVLARSGRWKWSKRAADRGGGVTRGAASTGPARWPARRPPAPATPVRTALTPAAGSVG